MALIYGALSMILAPVMAEAASLNHYSDYGVVEQSSSANNGKLSIGNDPFGYSDEYTDNESGLQYLQVRYYNPVMMRFTQMDTYPLLNRYSYANENPVMNDDPTGHSSQSTIGSIGGIIGDVGMGLGSLGSIGSIVAGALTGNPIAIIGGIMGLTSIGLGVGSQETDNSALRLGLGISSLVVGMSAMAVDYAVGTSSVAKSSNAANNLMLGDDEKSMVSRIIGEDYKSSDAIQALQKRISENAFTIFSSWSTEDQEKYLELPAYDTMSQEMLQLPFQLDTTPEEGIKSYMDRIESDLSECTRNNLQSREEFESMNKLKPDNRSLHEEFLQRTLGILDNNIREYLRLQDLFDRFTNSLQ